MVDYSIFPLDEEIKDKLAKLEISYAFQPIFYPNGRDIYAYEALMRPKNIGVMAVSYTHLKEDDVCRYWCWTCDRLYSIPVCDV